MIIICPCGEKKFEVDENLIPDKGRLLKCGSCDQTWFFNKNVSEQPEPLIDKPAKKKKILSVGFFGNDGGNAKKFTYEKNISSSKVDKQLSEGYLLSYLFYDNGVIKYDGKAKKGRFRDDITDETLFYTHSTGKSITSYIVGHAICDGYISSLDEI